MLHLPFGVELADHDRGADLLPNGTTTELVVAFNSFIPGIEMMELCCRDFLPERPSSNCLNSPLDPVCQSHVLTQQLGI